MEYPQEWTNRLVTSSKQFSTLLRPPPKVSTTDRIAVLIDSRNDMRLLHVFRVFLYHLVPKNFAFRFYHTSANRDFAHTFLQPLGVECVELPMSHISVKNYNSLCLDPSFWNNIPAEHILVFQMDTFLRSGDIEPFLQYDYVGAPWHPVVCSWLKTTNRVGNGGLSLRRKSAMLRCLRAGRPNREQLNEDRYFCNVCEDLLRLPDTETARSFSVETWAHPSPLGFHKPWEYVSAHELYSAMDA